MRLNSWIGLLFHTIIVALCGALIWAMNYFAADWGFLYDHIAIKIIISLLPVLLYWVFAKLLPGKREKSRDFTSGLGIILVSIAVFAVAMVGHRGNFLDQGFGESIWTLPLDVFLLPMVLVSSVWHLGYSYIAIGVAAVLPTILYALSRKVSRIGKDYDEELDEEDLVDEGIEEVIDAEEPVLEAEDRIFSEEEMKVANKNAVAMDQTIQWNKEELASEAQAEELHPEAEPVVTPVSSTASVAGEGLSPEEIALIMEARAKRQAATGKSTAGHGVEKKEKLPSSMQEMPHVESGSNTPSGVIQAEGADKDKKAEIPKGMQEMPHVESGSNTPSGVIEAEAPDKDKKAEIPKGMQEMPHVESGSNTPLGVIQAEAPDKDKKSEIPKGMQEMPHVESGSNTPSGVIEAEAPDKDKKAEIPKDMQEMPHVESRSNTPSGVIEGKKTEKKEVQTIKDFKQPEILRTTEARDLPEVKGPVIAPEAKEYVDTLVEVGKERKSIPDFLKRTEVGKEAEESTLVQEDMEDDGDFEEAWEETKDAIRGFFNRDKKRPRRDNSSRTRRNRTSSSRSSRVEKPRIEEPAPKLEVEWRSNRRPNSSLRRPDYTKRASREFRSGEDQIKDILFDDKEQG